MCIESRGRKTCLLFLGLEVALSRRFHGTDNSILKYSCWCAGFNSSHSHSTLSPQNTVHALSVLVVISFHRYRILGFSAACKYGKSVSVFWLELEQMLLVGSVLLQ